MTNLEDRLLQIEQRNIRVQVDKAWESSLARRLTIAAITYLTACLFLWLISANHAYINAIVPTGGYLLSTLSLPWIKEFWAKNIIKKNSP